MPKSLFARIADLDQKLARAVDKHRYLMADKLYKKQKLLIEEANSQAPDRLYVGKWVASSEGVSGHINSWNTTLAVLVVDGMYVRVPLKSIIYDVDGRFSIPGKPNKYNTKGR